MQAFVATFGVSTLMVGICKFLTGGGQYYSTSWPSGFSILGQGFVLGIIPVSVILLALCTIIAFVFMEKTKTCLLYTSHRQTKIICWQLPMNWHLPSNHFG